MDGMDQNDSILCARRRLRLWHMQSWVFLVLHPLMLGIMAGMNQKDSCVARWPSSSLSCRVVLSTVVIPQLLFFDKVIDDPVVRVVQVFPSRSHCVQRQVPWLRSTVAALQQGRLHPCRGVRVPQLPLVRRQSRSHSCSC